MFSIGSQLTDRISVPCFVLPASREVTNLGKKDKGGRVNLLFDIKEVLF